MKKDLHPEFNEIEIKCATCNAIVSTKSTSKEIKADTCSNCHPFFTGSETGASKAGRAEKFNAKFSRNKE